MIAAANARDQARGLATRLAAHLRRSGGVLAVPGGTTPAPLFDALARRDAGWRNVTVALTDERWVPPTHPASNERQVRRHLLRAQAQAARFVPLKSRHRTARAAVPFISSKLREPLDICILGMGDDGHIASLFPGVPQARAGAVQAVYVKGAAGSADRLSLTMRAILSAKLIVILLRGREKLAALKRWLSPDAPETPIRTLMRARRGAVWLSWSP